MSDEHHVGEDRETPSMEKLRAEEQREESQRREALFAGEYEVEAGSTGVEVAPASVDNNQCRFCQEELDDHAALTEHTCEGMRLARSRAPVEDGPLLETGVHELGANLLFQADNMNSYWAIVSQFDEALGNEASFEAVGEEWILNHEEQKIKAWDGKIAAREQDSTDYYKEYQLNVVVPDGIERKRINFQFRPSLPNPQHCETGNPIQSLPDDLPYGVRVQVDSGNVEPGEVVDVLQELAKFLDINPNYFNRDRIHPWSRCYNLAHYVRIRRAVSEQRITSRGGLLDRLAQFSSQRRGKGMYEWDNEEIIGHRNVVVMNETSCKQYLRGQHGQQVGKLLKSYHMKDPEKNATEVSTTHPKLEVQFSTEHSEEFDSLNSEHVPWGSDENFDVSDLDEELEEWLLNTLHWAGLPLRDDDTIYVEDQYWDVEESHRDVPLVDDPTDKLEEAHRDLATHHIQNADLSDAERDVLQALTDGGELHYETLADDAETSESTVYRLVDKLDAVLSRNDGRISLASDVIRERFKEVLKPIEAAADWALDQLPELNREDSLISDDSAFAKWMRTYGVSSSEHRDQYAFEIEAGYFDKAEIQEVLRAGYDAARQVGPHFAEKFIDASVSWRDADGDRRRLDRAAVITDGSQIRFLGAALRDVG